VGNNQTKPAPASQENILSENRLQPAILAQNRPRLESASDLKAFINEKELLQRIPVCRRTIYNWIRNGKLPCVKIGRRKLFHWPTVEATLLRLQKNMN
jgi:excisionase family DNA binding protein